MLYKVFINFLYGIFSAINTFLGIFTLAYFRESTRRGVLIKDCTTVFSWVLLTPNMVKISENLLRL